MAKNAHAISFYAEDFREEKSGQISLIGMFDDVLQIGSIPATLPRLSILSVLTVSTDDVFEVSSFRVFFENGATLASGEIPAGIQKNTTAGIAEASSEHPSKDWTSMKIFIKINNVLIEKEDTLCVEFAAAGGATVHSNALQVTMRPDPQANHAKQRLENGPVRK